MWGGKRNSMKGIIRISILCTFVVWLFFLGGWDWVCTKFRLWQKVGGGSVSSPEGRGVKNAIKRNADLSKIIKKEEGGDE
jgi:hypothetical protein